jgi:hypothetical protein
MSRSGISFDELPAIARRAAKALVPSGADLEEFDRIRLAPPEKTLAAYLKNESLYRSIQEAASGAEQKTCDAGGILISGCRDNEFSWDGKTNGLFTLTLKHVWNGGAFAGNYGEFHRAIKQYLVGRQTPDLFLFGHVSEAFRRQRPFSISSSQGRRHKREKERHAHSGSCAKKGMRPSV